MRGNMHHMIVTACDSSSVAGGCRQFQMMTIIIQSVRHVKCVMNVMRLMTRRLNHDDNTGQTSRAFAA